MAESMNLNVRISGSLKDYVTHEVQDGAYENVSEYVRGLIREDKKRAEDRAFKTLKSELQLAFSAPDSEYINLSADDIKNRFAK
jgi:antitoxin ParD1/3/4